MFNVHNTLYIEHHVFCFVVFINKDRAARYHSILLTTMRIIDKKPNVYGAVVQVAIITMANNRFKLESPVPSA